ncbi:hypothetical protein BN946_scf184747.g11 [Trametes cinnabarina]|uniref:Uncharacterized protein n=1 Tax=Pycnoporus cinnabarinus TaxID=5643 RepID=A0A060SXE3_PYCCI|nr:hypothetical protein BN946_scf184747.g11 [Trametes cinnabarina]
MPEYVYALHDFTPENPDEVSFRVGDKIEVIEKDELYGDGWWQGRNPAGQTGLFPQSYTSPTPPASSTIAFPDATPTSPVKETANPSPLQTLPEETESTAGNDDDLRQSPTESERERKRKPSNGDVMMRATMTDVQKAIEQLGRNDGDGSRSFSFASSHGDYSERSETETDDDHEADAEDDGLGWHKDARAKLAERAQKENEQRQAREAEQQARAMIPPIDVEVSDESDVEDDDSPQSPRRHRQYPKIAEEDEDAQESPKDVAPLTPSAPNSSEHIIPSSAYLVPDETDLPTATAATFPESSASPTPESPVSPVSAPVTAPVVEAEPEPEQAAPEPQRASTPSSSPPVHHAETGPIGAPIVSPTPSTMKIAEQLPFSANTALPSPTTSTAGSYGPSSINGLQQTLTPGTTVASFKTSASTTHPSGASTPDASKKPSTHPSEWTVEEVVDWLRLKGFDQGVCDKFIEQEITGDVLLELDANVLKTEIGIAAFGKRARIVNAISELRRPPSIAESEQQAPPVLTPRSLTHSFQYPGSHHSHPSHSHSYSMQSSAHQSLTNSPMYAPPSPSVGNGLGSAGIASITSPESPPNTGELSSAAQNGWRASDPGSIAGNGMSASTTEEDVKGRSVAGLGLGLPSASPQANGAKARPAQLVLSPSDSALGEKVTAIQGRASDSIKDDRAVMSETESVRTKEPKSRRRLFGRSTDSSSLKEKPASIQDNASQHSAGTPVNSPPASASPVDEQQPVRRRSKGGKGVEERKPDRLSLFGASFTGTLGKHRKPPPRLSNVSEKPEGDKHSLGTFSRFRESKRSLIRPGSSDGTVRREPKESEKKLRGVESEKEVETEKEQDKAKDQDDEKEKAKAKAKSKEKKERALSLSPSKDRDPQVLRKRTSSAAERPSRSASSPTTFGAGVPTIKVGQSILEQIGTPDHNGWLRKKGERYNSWKTRYFVLKGPHLYWLRSESKAETKIKGYLNIAGYKVMADESIDPGRYGFRIVHDQEKPHYFSSDEQLVVREWMKALMKATITRDYSNPVMSSCNIPTIPLTVAQAMNPAPRPPSPTARDATQKALRRENPEQLSSRDAQVLLMGMPNKENGANGDRARVESFFTNDTVSTIDTEPPAAKNFAPPKSPVPPRPSREMRRASTSQGPSDYEGPVDANLIEWANSHLPSQLHIKDTSGSLCGGLALLRLAEDIRGKPASPPVPDAAFPTGPNDDKVEGLFRLFDYLLDNDVKMGTVSINDIRQGKRDKIVQLLRALRAWEDKRKAIAASIGKGSVVAGPFMGMAGPFDHYKSL